MSKSGIRLLTLVAVSGAVVVGALSVVGVRASRHARRPPGAITLERLAENESAARARQAREEERAIEAASPPAPGSTALLPTIAARRQFVQEMATLAAAGAPVPPPAGNRAEPAEPHPQSGADPRRVILKKQIEVVLARHPNVDLAFVNCDEPDCRVRAEARDLNTLKAFVTDAAAVASTMKVHVEMVSSAFNGTSYRADWEGPPPAPPPPTAPGG